jgi:hypothetical protein
MGLVEPRRIWRLFPGTKPFEGELGDPKQPEFRIRRINPYLGPYGGPEIRGRVDAQGSGTMITGATFVPSWLIMISAGASLGLGAILARGLHTWPPLLVIVPLGCMLAVWLATVADFAWLSPASLCELAEALV